MSASLNLESLGTNANTISVEVKPTARERNWFQSRLERGRKERFTETANVTPGIASLMLGQNLGNRPLAPSQVRTHSDRLQRGDFILTHQGISFAKAGVLNDGQHRLTAILETGVTGPIQVTFGAEREEFQVVDQSKKRGAADVFGILGEDHRALRASVARFLFIATRPNLNAKLGVLNPDPQLVVDWGMEHRSETMDVAMRVGMNMKQVTSPTAAAVAYWWITERTKRPDKIGPFWDGLHTGESLSGARLRLREWLRESDAARMSQPGATALRAAAIISAWNAFVMGRRTFPTAWKHAYKLPDVS